jgi:hypothetical protein
MQEDVAAGEVRLAGDAVGVVVAYSLIRWIRLFAYSPFAYSPFAYSLFAYSLFADRCLRWICHVDTAQAKNHAEGWWENSRGRAPHVMPSLSRIAKRREHHRIEVPSHMFHPGAMEDSWGSLLSTTPAGVRPLPRPVSGGVRAASLLAATPVFREALDHRLISPTASGVAASPQPQRARLARRSAAILAAGAAASRRRRERDALGPAGKDAGAPSRAPDTVKLNCPYPALDPPVDTTRKEPRRRPWGRLAGGRAPHAMPSLSRIARRREHHRTEVPSHMFHPGGMKHREAGPRSSPREPVLSSSPGRSVWRGSFRFSDR